ncbi:MAG TPA: PadR family transcriptional regulator [Rhizomicrobium sp.]|nr:PadR family transcriptional regulator [Rhizomicrobium sp.]
MSSIRLFVLSVVAEFGPVHGHLIRQFAERMQAPLWTDISVGAIYGAINRLASEGLLRETKQERAGNRPTRQLYEITEEGRRALDELRREGLSEIWFKPDPFDLALTRIDRKIAKTLPAILAKRLEAVRAMLAERRKAIEAARPTVGVAKLWVLRHGEYRLEAEVAYLTDLLKDASAIANDKGHK